MTTNKITLELTLDELKLIDKSLLISVATKPILDKIRSAYPKPDVIEIGGVKYQRIEEPTEPMDKVVDKLENKWNSAAESAASYMTDEVIERVMKKWEENPPEFLKFEMGKTLEDLISRWWLDTHTDHKDWDVPTCVDDLVDQIQLWLPREQSAAGSQNVYVECTVEGFNDCLTKIKSKLRNKR